MESIKDSITAINNDNRKALTVFLTAGFPDTNRYVDYALALLDAGADILEIGIPFSDPLADGPIIQESSQRALEAGVNAGAVFSMCEKIRARTNKKLVAMGYANPILSYGVSRFMQDAANAGFDGLIVPDVPYDEYNNFYGSGAETLDRILLITPVTTPERVAAIDAMSRGFLYYVSVAGTTGVHAWSGAVMDNLQRVRGMQLQNKLQVGFGVSSAADVAAIKPYCDGVIVGSAIIKRLLENPDDLQGVASFVNGLHEACKMDAAV